MIWDLHGHFSGVNGATVDERIAKLMEYADRMGVERQVFFGLAVVTGSHAGRIPQAE